MAEQNVSSDAKLFSAISYAIWIIGPIITLITEKKNDAFAKHHAFQALFFQIVCWIVIFVTSFVLIGILLAPLLWLYTLYLAWRAYNGEKFMVPVVGNMASEQANKN